MLKFDYSSCVETGVDISKIALEDVFILGSLPQSIRKIESKCLISLNFSGILLFLIGFECLCESNKGPQMFLRK